jgi:hypothetical protein
VQDNKTPTPTTASPSVDHTCDVLLWEANPTFAWSLLGNVYAACYPRLTLDNPKPRSRLVQWALWGEKEAEYTNTHRATVVLGGATWSEATSCAEGMRLARARVSLVCAADTNLKPAADASRRREIFTGAFAVRSHAVGGLYAQAWFRSWGACTDDAPPDRAVCTTGVGLGGASPLGATGALDALDLWACLGQLALLWRALPATYHSLAWERGVHVVRLRPLEPTKEGVGTEEGKAKNTGPEENQITHRTSESAGLGTGNWTERSVPTWATGWRHDTGHSVFSVQVEVQVPWGTSVHDGAHKKSDHLSNTFNSAPIFEDATALCRETSATENSTFSPPRSLAADWFSDGQTVLPATDTDLKATEAAQVTVRLHWGGGSSKLTAPAAVDVVWPRRDSRTDNSSDSLWLHSPRGKNRSATTNETSEWAPTQHGLIPPPARDNSGDAAACLGGRTGSAVAAVVLPNGPTVSVVGEWADAWDASVGTATTDRSVIPVCGPVEWLLAMPQSGTARDWVGWRVTGAVEWGGASALWSACLANGLARDAGGRMSARGSHATGVGDGLGKTSSTPINQQDIPLSPVLTPETVSALAIGGTLLSVVVLCGFFVFLLPAYKRRRRQKEVEGTTLSKGKTCSKRIPVLSRVWLSFRSKIDWMRCLDRGGLLRREKDVDASIEMVTYLHPLEMGVEKTLSLSSRNSGEKSNNTATPTENVNTAPDFVEFSGVCPSVLSERPKSASSSACLLTEPIRTRDTGDVCLPSKQMLMEDLPEPLLGSTVLGEVDHLLFSKTNPRVTRADREIRVTVAHPVYNTAVGTEPLN